MEINGYPNYLIYEDGRIWSKNIKKNKKYELSKFGYKRISLYNKQKRKCFLIHRLVALHYIPNPNNYVTVDHIDRNKLNNHISNLRWASRSMQNENRNIISNTGEKYILKTLMRKKYYYQVIKAKCFREFLDCNKYTLDDAINLRDSLLSIDN